MDHAFTSVMAACSIANIVKTSLGPVGLDKMLVDDVGVSENVFIHFWNFGVCNLQLNLQGCDYN